jgi:aspartate ammonia-lyase
MSKDTATRVEHDLLGSLAIGRDCLWGIHTQRALANFPSTGRRVPYALIAALATVKRAAAMTNAELGYLDKTVANAIAAACDRIPGCEEEMAKHFPLDALQGGAGTSTNMNVNEVIANLALRHLGKPCGDYDTVHPIHHVNLHGSTNDLYPTALRVAAIGGVRRLSASLAKLQGAFQDKEKAFASIVKMGRTEMQAAVPMTLGQEFSAFAEAVARDRWRTFKCEERLRLVNLGGTAIGTGLTAPRDYIFRVIEVLRSLTGMGLSRNENAIDGTANADAFVEVSGILKACAATLSKIAGDLRLLHFLGEIELPPLQAGSSIMPGKVNPVMMEAVMQTGMAVRANDMIVTECAARGTLQINEFMPAIAWALLDSICMLDATAEAFANHIAKIEGNAGRCAAFVDESTALITAFVPRIGYDRANALIEEYSTARSGAAGLPLREFLAGKFGRELVDEVLSPQNLVRLGMDTHAKGPLPEPLKSKEHGA